MLLNNCRSSAMDKPIPLKPTPPTAAQIAEEAKLQKEWREELEYTRRYVISLIPTMIIMFIYFIYYLYLVKKCSEQMCSAEDKPSSSSTTIVNAQLYWHHSRVYCCHHQCQRFMSMYVVIMFVTAFNITLKYCSHPGR